MPSPQHFLSGPKNRSNLFCGYNGVKNGPEEVHAPTVGQLAINIFL